MSDTTEALIKVLKRVPEPWLRQAGAQISGEDIWLHDPYVTSDEEFPDQDDILVIRDWLEEASAPEWMLKKLSLLSEAMERVT